MLVRAIAESIIEGAETGPAVFMKKEKAEVHSLGSKLCCEQHVTMIDARVQIARTGRPGQPILLNFHPAT